VHINCCVICFKGVKFEFLTGCKTSHRNLKSYVRTGVANVTAVNLYIFIENELEVCRNS
jgi:hypothetical protein